MDHISKRRKKQERVNNYITTTTLTNLVSKSKDHNWQALNHDQSVI
jgi:hypothetical protein